MATTYLNSQRILPRATPDPNHLHERTPVEEYDLNSYIPAPRDTLETEKLKIVPFIPLLHADALSDAFCAPPPAGSDGDIWFYPYPKGKPFESKHETLMYIEKQRLRPNVLTFAVIDKLSGELAAVMSVGCDPLQGSLDAKLLAMKVFPKFRRTHVFIHGCYLLLRYLLNPVAKGGLGLARVGWRTPPENKQSQKAAEKAGLTREGIMRCYEVLVPLPGSPYPEEEIADGSGRATEDGVVYSMTCHDWLSKGKRERMEGML
ncbi:Gnat family [Mycena kentingensis (nom. inval.)]|nr:Gnat family [Mycena kentingensis (nom. inval.)]